MMVRIFSAGVNPTPMAPIPPPAQTARARSAVPPARAMPALAKGWRQPKRSVIRVEMLPILSDLPQTARVTDRFDGNRAGGPKPRRDCSPSNTVVPGIPEYSSLIVVNPLRACIGSKLTEGHPNAGPGHLGRRKRRYLIASMVPAAPFCITEERTV